MPERLPRPLHPGAWWLWALALATAASRTSNPLLLAMVAAVAGYVVAVRRTDAPWARSYAAFLRLGLVVLAMRVLLGVLFEAGAGGHVLVRLPSLPLPGWAAGVRVGGTVTAEGLTAAAYDGLRLAVLLVCVGAANALASPSRLLRALPGALYEAGVAVTVALSFAPQAVVAVGRVRAARRLRGRTDRGPRALAALAVAVLEGALERSLELAAAMDSRGFGRHGARPAAQRRAAAALTTTGLLATCASGYGLLDAGSPGVLGVPLLVTGTALAVAGLVAGGRHRVRSRYRPDPWRWPEWAVAGAGAAVAVVYVVGGPGLHPSTAPLQAPGLPWLPTAGVLLGLLPAWLAPPAVAPHPVAVGAA